VSAPYAARLARVGPIRTLPLRLDPQPGEALDSWLEALASRADTAWGDIAAATGLYCQDGDSGRIARRGWLVALAPAQQRALSVVTGVDPVVIAAMTLQRFRGKARIDSGVHTVRAPLRWLHSYVSRYCPDCLAETGGRWQSWWRLKWAFACPTHLRLLADACPVCHGVQRHRDLPDGLIPTPGRCARKAVAARGRNLDRCGAILSAAPGIRLAVDHSAIRAQQVMLNAIVGDIASHGIYAQHPLPVEVFLNDVRAVGRRILAYSGTENLRYYVPEDLIGVAHAASVDPVAPQPLKTRSVWATAPAAAAAATAALAVLGAPDIAEAGDRLRAVVADSRSVGLSVSASNIGWGRGASQTLTGVQLRALTPFLGPTDQLRYRLSAGLPTRPDTSPKQTPAVVRRIPALLWLGASVRFAHPQIGAMQLRSALSVALTVVGNRLTLAEAAHRLGSVTTAPATSRVLQILHASQHWPTMLAALTRLASHLEENPPPINYQVRRTLLYDDLLSDTEWALICRDTRTPAGRGLKADLVRCWLYERLSGSPGSRYTSARDTAEFRAKLTDFARQLSPELLRRLETSCRRFLDNCGLVAEPTTWCPPNDIFNGLALPGFDPAEIDIPKLHDLLRDEQLSVCQAAQRLNASPATLQYLLETAPPPTTLSVSQFRARGGVFVGARTAITKSDLLELYQRQHRSLVDIGRLVGVSRQTITRLAREYAVPIRPPCRPHRTSNG
jgi:TniQ